ncbi:molecular chaperone DnaJ [Salmonella enterica]|nr:molecular chaperone DnaJ [Salmonella enterica]
MTTITREEVKAFIEQIESDLSNGWEAQIFELKLARIALASLEAKPVAYMSRQNATLREKFGTCDEWDVHHQSVGADFPLIEIPESDDYEIMPLHILPPAPVMPETLPCSVELKPGLIIGKGCKTETLLTALKRRADYYAELEAITPEQRAEHDAGIAEFKAMLEGNNSAAMQSFGNSERLNQAPVKQPSSDEVIGWLRSDYNSDDKRDPDAPLFMLGSNNPSETWGVKYMPLTGNSPVTPDGWKLAPEKADEDMIAEGNIMASCMIETVGKIDVSLIYGAMLAAAPQQEVNHG